MNYRELLIPLVIALIGLVVLFAGARDGARLAGRILAVILGAIVLFLIFGFIVGRAL